MDEVTLREVEYAYYVQRYGTRDRLNARTAEAAIAEGMAMKGATGIVRVTMEQVHEKVQPKPSAKQCRVPKGSDL
jgi:hypothetical protein